MNAYAREWVRNNQESERERWRAYREENRDKIRDAARLRMRAKRAADKEAALAYTREYRAANPERVRQWDAKKKAVRRGAIAEDRVTADEWRKIKAKYSNCCAYCLKPFKRLQMDHVVALAKGGRHIASNIVPACISCNSSKQAKDALEWVQEKHGRLV